MQRWEYLDIHIGAADLDQLGSSQWTDSSGEQGRFASIPAGGSRAWTPLAPMLNRLGTKGWELISIVTNSPGESYRLVFKRPQQSEGKE